MNTVITLVHWVLRRIDIWLTSEGEAERPINHEYDHTVDIPPSYVERTDKLIGDD